MEVILVAAVVCATASAIIRSNRAGSGFGGAMLGFFLQSDLTPKVAAEQQR